MKYNKHLLLILSIFTLLIGVKVFAQVEVTDDSSFFSALFDYIKGFFTDNTGGAAGGATPIAKICGGIILLISTAKVSFLKPLWDKLLTKQEWVAPVLGLLVGILGMVVKGSFDWSFLLTAVASGALAPYVHDILDKIKAIPGIGSVWLTIISFIQVVLFAPKDSQPSA